MGKRLQIIIEPKQITCWLRPEELLLLNQAKQKANVTLSYLLNSTFAGPACCREQSRMRDYGRKPTRVCRAHGGRHLGSWPMAAFPRPFGSSRGDQRIASFVRVGARSRHLYARQPAIQIEPGAVVEP
jgi:hypothetical protein